MLVTGQKNKMFIENMIDDLKYPQEWQLKEIFGFNHISPKIEMGSHGKTERKH